MSGPRLRLIQRVSFTESETTLGVRLVRRNSNLPGTTGFPRVVWYRTNPTSGIPREVESKVRLRSERHVAVTRGLFLESDVVKQEDRRRRHVHCNRENLKRANVVSFVRRSSRWYRVREISYDGSLVSRTLYRPSNGGPET